MFIALGLIVIVGTGISTLNTDRLDIYNDLLADMFSNETNELLDGPLGPLADMDIDVALKEVMESDSPFEEKLAYAQEICSLPIVDENQPLPDLDGLSGLTDEQRQVATAFMAACLQSDDTDRLTALQSLTNQKLPFANYAIALLHLSEDDTESAEASLKEEIAIHNSEPAKELLIQAYILAEWTEPLHALITDPDYADLITAKTRLHIGLTQMDWALIIRSHFPAAYEDMHIAIIILATLSGSVWVLILLSFGGFLSWKTFPVKMLLPALVLGALSTHLTLFCIYWQEYQMGFREGDTSISQFIYCVLGGSPPAPRR